MWARIFGFALVSASCRAPQPCAPAPEPEPEPACTITATEAQARADVYLAGLAGGTQVPPQFKPASACRSHCMKQYGIEGQSSERCPSWECSYWYGPKLGATRYTHMHFDVHVIRCGERAFTGMRLATCFAKPHGCAFEVDRAAALAVAEQEGIKIGEMLLSWSAAVEEFEWVVWELTDAYEYREVRRIGAHTPAPRKRPGKR